MRPGPNTKITQNKEWKEPKKMKLRSLSSKREYVSSKRRKEGKEGRWERGKFGPHPRYVVRHNN